MGPIARVSRALIDNRICYETISYDHESDHIQSANTLIIRTKDKDPIYFACVVLASTRLDTKRALRKIISSTGRRPRICFAGDEVVEVTGGMIPGGISLIGLPPGIKVLIDSAVMLESKVIVGAGDHSCTLIICPQEFHKIADITIVDTLSYKDPVECIKDAQLIGATINVF